MILGCTKGGIQYQIGEKFPAPDSCNECTCQADGTILCSTDPCCKYLDLSVNIIVLANLILN